MRDADFPAGVWRSVSLQPKYYHCAGDYKLSDSKFQHLFACYYHILKPTVFCSWQETYFSFNFYFDIRGKFKLEYCHQQVKNGASWTERWYVFL